jgi:hypothetical protein
MNPGALVLIAGKREVYIMMDFLTIALVLFFVRINNHNSTIVLPGVFRVVATFKLSNKGRFVDV